MRELADDTTGFKDPILTNVLAGAKEQIEGGITGASGKELNPGAYASFYYNFIHNIYMPQRAAGTLPPNALDISDPKSLISQAIAPYKSPIAKIISGNGGIGAASAATSAAPAAAAKPALKKSGYQKGDVQPFNGHNYQFQGGNWRDKNNWKPIS